ncbi:MAG: invasin domain 3-containing protein [Balneolaceae bacterium]|nr:invasin domain 3-containing protein [Balneolaceae bacterium]
MLTSSTSQETAVINGEVNGSAMVDQAQVEFTDDPAIDDSLSTIEADPNSIPADGSSTSDVTVTLVNEDGDQLTSGGDNVTLFTNAGSLSGVSDNGDGTYSAVLTSSTSQETAVINGEVNGSAMVDQAQVEFTDNPAIDDSLSTIEADPNSIPADGSSTSDVTVTLVNEDGDQLTSGGDNVTLSTSAGTLSGVTDNGDGTYSAELTSSTSQETAVINGEVNGSAMVDQAQVEFTEDDPAIDDSLSTIEANPNTINADGASISDITVTLVNEEGDQLTSGGDNVTLSTSAGTLSGVTDNGDGTYSAELTSSTVEETATIQGTFNGNALQDQAQVTFEEDDHDPPISTELSSISATPNAILADGSSTSNITVQLIDEAGDPIGTGGDNVTLFTNAGSLSGVSDNGDGTYSAVLTSSTSQETATINGRVNGSPLEDQAQVEFTEEDPAIDDSLSTIEANPNTINADGASISDITVTLVNEEGDQLTSGGDNVQLSTSAGTLSGVTDNGDGTYSAELTSSTVEETATIQGTFNGNALQDQAQVTFEEDDHDPPISTELSSISATPNAIPADGSSTSNITVQLIDEAGDPIGTGGDNVTLFTNAGSLSGVSDNGDGTYSAVLTSSTSQETATITGRVNGSPLEDQANVEFQLDDPEVSKTLSTIEADPNAIPADGTSTSDLTVTLVDENGTPLSAGGNTVALSTDAGSIGGVTDNGDGTYSAVLTASNSIETATVTGTVDGSAMTDEAQVDFEAEPPSGNETVIMESPDEIMANGSSTSEIVVVLYDEDGDRRQTGGAEVDLTTTDGTLGEVTDHGDGSYTAPLTSAEEPETAIVTAEVNDREVDDLAEVDFLALPPSGERSTITALPGEIPGDGESTSIVTVSLFDQNGDRIQSGGENVTLSTSAGNLGSVTDNGDGTYTAMLTSTEGTATAVITGQINGSQIQDQAEVTFTAPPPSDDHTTIEADPNAISADGESTSTLTVTLFDANGERITSSGGEVTLSTTEGTLGKVTDHGDGTYTATLTSSTRIVEAVITGRLNGGGIDDKATVQFNAGGVSIEESTITADPNAIPADGEATSEVTVVLRDAAGNRLPAGAADVIISTTLGSLGEVTDQEDGSYTATLTSEQTAETAVLTATADGEDIDDQAEVIFQAGDLFTCEVQNLYPNPFSGQITFKLSVPDDGNVRLRLWDILGQRVATPLDREVSAGVHEVSVNGSHLSSGVYIYRYICPRRGQMDTGQVTKVGGG